MQSLEKQVKNRYNVSEILMKLLRRVLKLEQAPSSGGGGGVTLPIEISDVNTLQTSLDGLQPTLVSGTNIKTVNNTTLLGAGNINLIPLTGTTVGNPVTGNIEIGSTTNAGLFKNSGTGNNLIDFLSDTIRIWCRKTTSITIDACIMTLTQALITLRSVGASSNIKSEIRLSSVSAENENNLNNRVTLSQNGLSVDVINHINGGLWATPGNDYSASAIDTSFMQKSYVDRGPILYSFLEVATGGIWVDLKPIYRIVKLTVNANPAGIDTIILARVVGSYTILEYTKV